MSQLWMEGFDQYGGNINNMLDGVWAAIEGSNADIELSAAQARTGSYSLYVNAVSSTTGTVNAIRRVLPSGKTEIFASFGIYMPELPLNNTRFAPVTLRDAGNSSLVTIAVTATGQIRALTGSITGSVLADTSGPVLTTGTWHHVEVRVVIHASTGIIEVRVDEEEVMNLTNQNLGSTAVAQWAVVGKNSDPSNQFGRDYYVDDLVIRDGSGTYNNDFQGDLRVATLQPIANAAAQGWAVESVQKIGAGVANFNDTNSNEGLAYDDDAAFEIGSSDFCVETYVRWDALATGDFTEQIIGKYRTDNDTRSWRLFRTSPNDGSLLRFSTSTDGSLATVEDVIEFPFIPILKRWYHLAVSRDSGVLRMFINGIQVGVDTADVRTYYDGTAQVLVNGQQGAGTDTVLTASSVDGWYDCTRITIGSARYTANFTPPAVALVDDANTVLGLNYDDDDNTDISVNAFVGTFVSGAFIQYPDDELAFQTIDGLSPDDTDFISADLIAATGTLTLTANPLDTEQVVLGSTTYTFQTSLTDSANNVLIGTDAEDSLANLKAAVNGEAGAGTLYGTGTTPNADATLSDLPGDQVLATASTPGAAGNSITSTTDVTGASWSDTTLGGGADIPGVSEFDLSALPAEVTGVKAVALVGRNFKLDSGSSEMRMSLKTAAGGVSDGATRPVTLTPTYYEDTIEEDPNTMGALTTSTVNGSQIRFGRIT